MAQCRFDGILGWSTGGISGTSGVGGLAGWGWKELAQLQQQLRSKARMLVRWVGGWVGGPRPAQGLQKVTVRNPVLVVKTLVLGSLGSEILVKTMALSSQGSKLLVKTMVLRSSCSLPAGPPKRFFKKWLRIVAF